MKIVETTHMKAKVSVLSLHGLAPAVERCARGCVVRDVAESRGWMMRVVSRSRLIDAYSCASARVQSREDTQKRCVFPIVPWPFSCCRGRFFGDTPWAFHSPSVARVLLLLCGALSSSRRGCSLWNIDA